MRFCPSFRRLQLVIVLAGALSCSPKIDRPAPPITRSGPEMSSMTAENRDTLFARAVAAVRERGYTEVSPDQPHWQVRAKTPTRVSVVISLVPAGDSTKVTVQATGERHSPGLDTDAMATVLTLMSDIAPPPVRVPATAKPQER
jgi:hypothetical protein